MTLGTLTSCIDKFEPEGLGQQEGVLVVDAIIIGGTTIVELNRTLSVETEWDKSPVIDKAALYVECNDGSRFTHTAYQGNGIYEIETPPLDSGRQYRLHISLDGEEYESEYLSPLFPAGIDSVSWQKQAPGEPVYITVSTHGKAGETSYYRWTYEENWEFKSELYANYGRLNGREMYFDLMTPNNIYYCWGSNLSRSFVLATSSKLSENVISHKRLLEIPPADEKLSELYHIAVSQYRIRKEAYDYYYNLQKNVSQTGGIFSHIPSEMRGNVRSLTSPDEWVIGYVEVSVPSTREQFMPELIMAYEVPKRNCHLLITTMPYDAIYQKNFDVPTLYAPQRCVDCTTRGTKNKPAFWPTDHL
jgi:hypothetical protein